MDQTFTVLGFSLSQTDILAFTSQFLVPSLNGFITSYLAQHWKRDRQISMEVEAWEVRCFVGIVCAALSLAESYASGSSVTLGTFVAAVYSYTVAVTKYDFSYKGK